jgi:tetratricopeptide (TPR) repeat protein
MKPSTSDGKRPYRRSKRPSRPSDRNILSTSLCRTYRCPDQGRYAEAEPLYKRALRIDEKALGPEHPDVAIDLNNLAELYRAQGHYAEAEPLYQRSLAILEGALGPEHPHVATSLENYAALLRQTARADEAERMEARAKAIRAKSE